MNNRIYLIPGLNGWTFKTADTGYGLWSPGGGPGVSVTSDMSATEIADRVKGIFWLNLKLSNEASEEAAKPALKVDWQAMIRESGTDVQHQSPSLPGWTLKISDWGSGLWYSSGAGIQITVDTPVQDIANGVRRVLQPILPPVDIDLQVDVILSIDFRALITNAWAPRVAPLLEGFKADNSALVEAICADVRLFAILQRIDNPKKVEAVISLLKEMAT